MAYFFSYLLLEEKQTVNLLLSQMRSEGFLFQTGPKCLAGRGWRWFRAIVWASYLGTFPTCSQGILCFLYSFFWAFFVFFLYLYSVFVGFLFWFSLENLENLKICVVASFLKSTVKHKAHPSGVVYDAVHRERPLEAANSSVSMISKSCYRPTNGC